MLNEFRQDIVSGDWVLFATERAGRPHQQLNGNNLEFISKDACPFEDLVGSGNEPVWFYPNRKSWTIAVIKNKFPAVKPGICSPESSVGPFKIHSAVGDHDLFIYKDHDRHMTDFSQKEMIDVVRAYKRRYREIMNTSDCVRYVLIFHNIGPDSGASIYHPHSQIMSLPILPPDVARSIGGSHDFFKKHGKSVAFCPFVSKNPYEVRIFMKNGQPHFEELSDDFDDELADVLLASLKKIKKALNSPSLSFFIHTASRESSHDHDYYSWHIEILPRFSKLGGFELGTDIEINAIDPDEAAQLLRETTI
ncbi:MAG: DUF4931 domain-containing protein [Candidatus Yanofskybacteria bacterium]|nr:DUF4931 domain-containing protein [Candidatus Yanofskybacteria bacterium]